MKIFFLSVVLFLVPRISTAATQVYIPSTSTYHNYVINIETGTIRQFTCSTCTMTRAIISSATIGNLTISTANINFPLVVSTLTVTSSFTATNASITNGTFGNISITTATISNGIVTQSTTTNSTITNAVITNETVNSSTVTIQRVSFQNVAQSTFSTITSTTQMTAKSPSSGTNTPFRLVDSVGNQTWGFIYMDSDGRFKLNPAGSYPFQVGSGLELTSSSFTLNVQPQFNISGSSTPFLIQQVFKASSTATTTTSTNFINTCLSSTITIVNAFSCIKVTITGEGGIGTNTERATYTLARGGSNILTASGFQGIQSPVQPVYGNVSYVYFDEPNTTGITNYSLQVKSTGGGTVYFLPTAANATLTLEEYSRCPARP